MKILHVHQTENVSRSGGGVIAMHRLHLGLKRAGVQSKMLCGVRTSELSDSAQIPRSKKIRALESLLGRVTWRLGLNDIHCISSFGIKKSQEYLDADILTFHGLQGGYFSYLALPSLTATKPAVVTLHDMWSFTGHCGFSYDCDRWKIGCGKCPYPGASPPIQRDNTRLEWKLKKWVYGRSNIAVTAPSNWLTEQAKQSMLSRFPIQFIPHGIDTEVYQPLDRERCRALLGIPAAKKVLMFAAYNLSHSTRYLSGWRKGGDLLVKTLQSLPESVKAEVVLLMLGDRGEAVAEAVDIQTVSLGYASGDRFKAIAYSAADLFVFPTRAETFGLVLLESMACGTPLVSFRVGGVPDLVRPGLTGYLAEPENVKDLCNGIVQLLHDSSLRHYMSQQCRKIVLEEYTSEQQVQRYIELYRQILHN